MRTLAVYILLILLTGCSAYRKVVLSGSDRLTNRWKGQTEQAVQNSLGAYKSKNAFADGFLIRYDYSYLMPAQIKKSGDFHVTASNQQTNLMAPPIQQQDHRSADDSVIRRMDFYFDKTQLVNYVQAVGFPDSVYMVKRK